MNMASAVSTRTAERHARLKTVAQSNGGKMTQELRKKILSLIGKKSYALIAREYGVTRNSIAGLVWRKKNPGKKVCGRGRHGTGEYAREILPHGNAKLLPSDIAEIRHFAATNKPYGRVLAKRFGVAPKAIYKVVSRATWKHVA